MSTSQSSQRLIAIAIVVIIALLGINGYLLYTKITQDKLIKQQNSELIAAERMQAELQKEYYQSLADLEELRTNNDELNALIDAQKEELKAQKDRIAGLLGTERDLDLARAELKKLRSMTNQYVKQIAALQEENKALAQSVNILEQEKAILVDEVQEERLMNQELQSENTALSEISDSLAAEREDLATKVSIASVIKVEEIEVTGYKIRSSGKEAEKKKAKVIDGLKICFVASENDITEPGMERFDVRVIDPMGETMAIDALGSGVIKDPMTGKMIRTTQRRELDYENQPANVCMSWQPGIPFNPGEYQIEIYNKGYLAGVSGFQLK